MKRSAKAPTSARSASASTHSLAARLRVFRLRWHHSAAAATLLTASFFAGPSAQAVTYYWDTTNGTWQTGADWSTTSTTGGTTGTVPGASDTAVFNQSSVNGAETVGFSANASIAGLIFNNSGTTLLDSSTTTTQTFTIGTTGITINSGAGAVTLGNSTNALNLVLNGSETWTNNSSNLFTAVNNITNTGTQTTATTLTLTLAGSGSGLISGVISNGVSTGTGTPVLTQALTMAGTGSWTLASATSNTYTGATKVNGGTLTLDFSNMGTATNQISASSALTLGGGTLAIKGKSGASTAQTFASTSFTANTASFLTVNQNGATAVNLTLGGLTHGAQGTVDVTLPTTGAVTTSTLNTGNAAGGNLLVNTTGTGTAYATANGGATFLVDNNGTFSAYSGFVNTYTSGSNVDVTNGDSVNGVTANTLRFNSANIGLTLAGANTLRNGAILVTPNSSGTISGSGTLQAGTGVELVIHNFGTLNVGSSIVDSGSGASSLTLAGTGVTTLGAANTYTGATSVNSGTLNLNGNSYVIGPTSPTLGSSLLGNGQIQNNSGSGTSTLTFAGAGNSFSGAIADNNGTNTGGKVALVVNNGGTVTLAGASTYSGGTTVNSGGVLSVGSNSTYTAQGALTNGPLGTGTLTLAGGTLGEVFGNTIGNAVSVTADSFLGNASLTGRLIWNGSVDLTGTVGVTTRTLSLFKNVTPSAYTANTGIEQLQLAQPAGSSTALSVSNGTLRFVAASGVATGSLTPVAFSSTVNFTGNAGLTLGNGVITTIATTTPFGTTASTSPTVTVESGGYLNLGNTSNSRNVTVYSLSGAGNVTNLSRATTAGTSTLTINGAGGSFSGTIADGASYTAFTGIAGTGTPATGAANGIMALTMAGTGTLTLSGANTYTGTTTINTGMLALGANNVINSTAPMTLSGGTFNANKFSQGAANGTAAPTQGLGALTLTTNSTIDFGTSATNNVLAYAASGGKTWTGTLTIADWNGTKGSPDGAAAGTSLTALYIGTDNTSASLTSSQLAEIVFSINGTNYTALEATNGEIYASNIAAVPEPSTWMGAVLTIAFGAFIGFRRKVRGA